MKAKYQTKKKFKNADDTFVYNTDKYCKIIAKKYGKDTKFIESYFNKFFEFLDEKGLLTNVVKRRINENIKAMYFTNSNKKDGGIASYYPCDNKIRIKYANTYNIKAAYLIHEFIHLCTSTSYYTDKRKTEILNSIKNKGTKRYLEKVGFAIREKTTTPYNETESLEKFKLDDLVDFLRKKLKLLTQTDLESFISIFDDDVESVDFKNKNKNIIDCAISNILSKFYNFNNVIIKNKKDYKSTLNTYIQAIKLNVVDWFEDSELENFYIGNNQIIDINKKQDYFYVHITKYNNLENKNYELIRDISFTEGATEFLARLFATSLTKKSTLLSDGYNMGVKYFEMMYKIFGDELLEAFFEQDNKKLAKMMKIQLDQEPIVDQNEYYENYELFKEWFDAACQLVWSDPIPAEKKQFKYVQQENNEQIEIRNTCRRNVITILNNCFIEKLTREVLQNLSEYNSSREIVDSLRLSVLEYSKSFYFGLSIKPLYIKTKESERLTTLHNCAKILSTCLSQIVYNYEVYRNSGMFSEEDDQKIASLPRIEYDDDGNEINTQFTQITKELVEELYSWCVKVNENSYHFAETDIKEIHPLEFLRGRKINMFENNKQEYLRNKTKIEYGTLIKFPTMKKFKKIKNDVDVGEPEIGSMFRN